MLGKASTVFSAPSCGWAGSNSRVSWFRVLTGLRLPQFGLAAWFGRYFCKCISQSLVEAIETSAESQVMITISQIACLMIWKIGIKPFSALKSRQKPH
ncbi:hypothetical protein C7K08_12005 [Synechococcus lacustris str. Tous]|uniref:Uncharacterized protein n=1 Tax=Synechococcus lacustris str. Tous TaxID=1910958 RepID=A0A2P7EBY6_9SYNE|nr:hypothetical protein C7K08_12005 [Synechococcus lacustris str. Tous]